MSKAVIFQPANPASLTNGCKVLISASPRMQWYCKDAMVLQTCQVKSVLDS